MDGLDLFTEGKPFNLHNDIITNSSFYELEVIPTRY